MKTILKHSVRPSEFIIFCSILYLFNSPLCARDSCKVTYIANDGFLIETKNHKILIDALFGNIRSDRYDQPDDSVLNCLIEGIAPFNNIDLILVTNKHSDHFNAVMTFDFLTKNPNSTLITPHQVYETLTHGKDFSNVSSRIFSIKSKGRFDTSLVVHNVIIRALRMDHDSYFVKDSVLGMSYVLHSENENLGYLIKADRFSFFHPGDCSSSDKTSFVYYQLEDEILDFAFVDRYFLRSEGIDIITDCIRTKNIILMHVEPFKREDYTAIIKNISVIHLFNNSFENKIYYKDSHPYVK